MNEALCQFFCSWPYDEALLWMKNAEEKVRIDPSHMIVGCGSHRESVITLGKDKEKNAMSHHSDEENLICREVDRGGGATAHEPGQLVLYPVLHMGRYRLTIPDLIFGMENTMINFLKVLGVKGERSCVGPGVYVSEKKIGFIGLRIKNKVTSHGLSINFKNDGKIFSYIVPCGIPSLLIGSVCEHVFLDEPMEIYMQLLAKMFLENFSFCMGAR